MLIFYSIVIDIKLKYLKDMFIMRDNTNILKQHQLANKLNSKNSASKSPCCVL